MPLFGAHMSIAGGLHQAILIAQKRRCQAVQLFTKSCQQWKARDLTSEEISTFRRTFRKSGVRLAMAHDCYLINLASPQKELYRQSVEAFIVEYMRAEQLGLRYLVTHPGSHIDSGEEAGLARVAQALDEFTAAALAIASKCFWRSPQDKAATWVIALSTLPKSCPW